MNFSNALYCLNQDKKISNLSWGGKNVYLYILNNHGKIGEKKLMIHYDENDFVDDIEYTVSSYDLFSGDWFVV